MKAINVNRMFTARKSLMKIMLCRFTDARMHIVKNIVVRISVDRNSANVSTPKITTLNVVLSQFSVITELLLRLLVFVALSSSQLVHAVR